MSFAPEDYVERHGVEIEFDERVVTAIDPAVLCPSCQFHCNHALPPYILEGGNYQNGWSGSGSLTVIPFTGECGSWWELCIGNRKGESSLFATVIRDCRFMSNDNGGFVYFAEAIGLNRVKIGYSNNPISRIDSLKTGVPAVLQLHLAIPGTPQLEAWVHQQFSKQRISGEWFHKDWNLTHYIAAAAHFVRHTEQPFPSTEPST